ncbi:MAG TPA: peptide chain release factor N(5)-glutamine methyltransferase [Candidatus Acidoferrum sp.]|nr:peptide chain release factor N(5)-glutamine methyltransferase [Candidatus Acidoferrum sp.]
MKEGLARLRTADVPSFTLAAELLLLHVVGRDRTWLYAHPEELIAKEDEQRYFTLLARRVAGEPTQYLTGKQEFWGLEFEVSSDVLIPRPETEHVVDVALDRLALREIRAGGKRTLTGDGLQIADVGTGSGCLAIALAKELPGAHFVATDVSAAALAVATRNAARHFMSDRIRFFECSLLAGVAGAAFDVVVSNPPYVGRSEKETLMREVREHEPEIALYGGEEGSEFYAALIAQAARSLKSGGLLVLELGHNSLPAVGPMLDPHTWANIGVTKDLAGVARVLAAERA